MHLRNIAVLLLSLASLCPLHAEEIPFTLFGRVEGGYSLLQSDYQAELNKDGHHFGIHGLVNFRRDWYSIDFGGGWFYNKMRKERGTAPILSELVKTKAGSLELSPRWRSGGWELGPRIDLLFGSDVAFGVVGNESSTTWLAGVNALYRWDLYVPVRVGISMLTDLSISERQLYLFLGGIHVGLPPSWFKKESREASSSPAANAVRPTVTRRILDYRSPPSPSDKTISFNADLIFFDVNSVAVRQTSRDKLLQLGKFLKQRHELWKTIRIVGHTDSQGSYDYNLGLSQKRAAAVLDILVQSGLNRDEMKSEGRSFSEPKVKESSEADRRLNRRVELILQGAEDIQEIEREIDRLELRSPED